MYNQEKKYSQLEKLIEKKKLKPIEESEQKAGMEALGQIQKDLSDSKKDKLEGLKKVSVMSNSPEGLEQGLEKAQDIVQHSDNNPFEGKEMHEEMMELEQLGKELSVEDLQDLIGKLEQIKQEKLSENPEPKEEKAF